MTNNYKPFIGGVPISIERLTEGLRGLGHQVTVFAPEGADCEEEPEVVRYRVLYERREKGIVIGNFIDRRIEKRFREEQFDVIHVHHPVVIGFTAVYLSKKYGIPLAYTYHTRYEEYLHYFKVYESMAAGWEPARKAARFGREVLVPKYLTTFTDQCDTIFVPTASMKECLVKQGVATPLEILPTGIGAEAFKRDPDREKEIRSRYLNGQQWLFATTARLEKEKNLDFLLRGAARLKELKGDCFRILIIGDGTRKEALKNLAGELGIGSQIVFAGRVPNNEVPHYLHAADGFLFASKSETQGIVLLEAMAAGCPVVAVRASGVVDVVSQEKNGFMTGEEEGEWASAAARLMTDPQLYQKLSAGAVKTASLYKAEAVAGKAEHQYRKMIERRTSQYGEYSGQTLAVPSCWHAAEAPQSGFRMERGTAGILSLQGGTEGIHGFKDRIFQSILH